MQTASPAFLAAVKSKTRQIVTKATLQIVGGSAVDLTKDDIVGGSLSVSYACMSGAFQLGACIAADATIRLDNLDGTWNDANLDGATLTLYSGLVLPDNTEEYIKLGTFIVDQPGRPYSQLQLKASDRMILLDVPFSVVTRTFPATNLQILQAIAAACGITLASGVSGMLNASHVVPERPADTMSCRDIVQEIALMAAGFGRMNRDGKLEIVKLSKPTSAAAYQLSVDDRYTFEQTNEAITITGLQWKHGLYGTTKYPLVVGDLALVQSESDTVLQSVFAEINGFTYAPFEATCPSNPLLDPGDVVEHATRDERTVLSLVTKHTFAAGKTTIAAEGSSEAAKSYSSAQVRQIAAAIRSQAVDVIAAKGIDASWIVAGYLDAGRIEAGSITTPKLAADAVTTEKLAAAAVTADKIKAGSVSADKMVAGTITAASGIIANAAIDTAQIKTGAIKTALIATGAVGTTQIADASITDAKVISLSASKLTAGTIDAGTINVTNLNASNLTVGTINNARLPDAGITAAKLASDALALINAKNKVYYSATAPSGGTYFVNDLWYDTDDGYAMYRWSGSAWTAMQLGAGALAANSVTTSELAAGAVTADKIQANCITAGQIASSTITATQLASGAVTTEKLAAQAVTAAKILSETITAAQIASKTITANEIATGTITAASGIIADAAIGTAQIADAAITNAKIASLDAGKITTGTLNAARVSIGSGTTFAAGYDPTLIAVGGRNIFKNSNYPRNTDGQAIGITTWGGNVQTGEYDNDIPPQMYGLSEKRICTTAGSGGGLHDKDSFVLGEGETYTLSYWAKATQASTHNGYLCCLNRISDNFYIFPIASIALTTEWQRFSATFTVGAGQGGTYRRRSIVYLVSTLWLSHFQLEKGNKVTDWTPAPEDVDANISASASSVKGDLSTNLGYTSYDDLVAKALQGKTIISGGYFNTELIKAGSILAEKLDVRAKSIINNPTKTGNILGWYIINGPGIIYNGGLGGSWGPNGLALKTDGSLQAGYRFEVDPNKTYKVDCSVWCDSSTPNVYIGVYLLDKTGQKLTYGYCDNAGTLIGTTNSFYAYAGKPTSVHRVRFYINASQSAKEERRPGIGNGHHYNAIMTNDTYMCILRVLNYYNAAGTETNAYFWSPSVTEVESGTIRGDSVVAGAIESTNGAMKIDLDAATSTMTGTVGGVPVVVTQSPAMPINVKRSGVSVAGITSDGYLGANRMMNMQYPNNFIEVGPQPGGDSLTLASFWSGTNNSKKRMEILSWETTALQFHVLNKDDYSDGTGTSIFEIKNGDCSLFLNNWAGSHLAYGASKFGINASLFNGDPYIVTADGNNHQLAVFTSIDASAIDQISRSGLYRVTGTAQLILHITWDAYYMIQIGHLQGTGFRKRAKTGSTWSAWSSF